MNYTDSLRRCYCYAASTIHPRDYLFLCSFKFPKDTRSSVLIRLIDSNLCHVAYTVRSGGGSCWGRGGGWEEHWQGLRRLSLLDLEAKARGSPRSQVIILKLSLTRVNRDAKMVWQRRLATSALPAGVLCRALEAPHLTHLNFITSFYFYFWDLIILNITQSAPVSKQLPLVTLRLSHFGLGDNFIGLIVISKGI